MSLSLFQPVSQSFRPSLCLSVFLSLAANCQVGIASRYYEHMPVCAKTKAPLFAYFFFWGGEAIVGSSLKKMCGGNSDFRNPIVFFLFFVLLTILTACHGGLWLRGVCCVVYGVRCVFVCVWTGSEHSAWKEGHGASG